MASMIVLAIRVTSDADEGYARTLEFVRRHGTRHFIVEHETDTDCVKKHAHVLVWVQGTRTITQWRQMFVKSVKPSGNRQYSMKAAPEPEVMERYMCHAESQGSTVKVISAQAPADDSTRYSASWCQAQNAAFYAAQRDFKSARKLRDVPLWKRVVAEAREHGIGADEPLRIAQLTVSLIKTEERAFNAFHARSQVQTALLHLSDPDGAYQRSVEEWLARPLN